ncbi:MAG TPA: hypothetical protein VFV02_08355, partial [Acidimicrobiales bacterium]|nr:hypothetical protein [Acidimicrobiales bacterium]
TADQEFLWMERHVIRRFLDRGRVVVWSGQLSRPWLPACGLFVPKRIRSVRDFEVHLVAPHPVFEGVDGRDLTFRRGVAGFFARGHNPPPPGVQVLACLGEDEPVVYVDSTTTAGTILAHSGTDLVGFADDDSTASRVVPQLLAWIEQEGGRP